MHVAYTTTFDATDVHNWSGTPYHMSKALQETGAHIDYIGGLKRKLPLFFKAKQVFKKYVTDQRESPRFNVYAAKNYSLQVAKCILSRKCDVVLSPLINPIAYLDCKQPIFLWTDALYAALLGFYAPFSMHSAQTITQGNAITQACLSRCTRIFFSSDWAARSAVELYGVNPNKVTVIPFGANIREYPDRQTIKTAIAKRPKDKINLLFLAKSWERKGGNKAVQLAEALHESGHAVELRIVGYYPQNRDKLPSFIKCLGFISKHTEAGKTQLQKLFAETHFLCVPSLAEAYGIVFCEANAYGIPCLTSGVGGIGTIIKDNINGIKYALDADITDYCRDVVRIMYDEKSYDDFAMSAYNEFTTRLNWHASTQQLVKTLTEFL